MQTALRVGAGMDDSQSVELRDRGGMAMTVLTLQQFWIAPPGFAMTRHPSCKSITPEGLP